MREISARPGTIELTDARTGHRTPIRAMTTLFDLVLIAVDRDQPLPSGVHQSLAEIARVMTGADATVAVLAVGADRSRAVEAADRIGTPCRVFADPEGRDAEALGLSATPGLVWISTAPEMLAVESGFDRDRWTEVLRAMAKRWAWSRPLLPTDAPHVAEPLLVGARPDPSIDEEETAHARAA